MESKSQEQVEKDPVLFVVDPTNEHIEDALLEKFERAIHKQTALYQHYDLIRIAVEHDPIDLARAVSILPLNARLLVFRSIPEVAAKSLFLMNTTSSTRAVIFRALPDEEIRRVVEQMPADEAVFVLEDLPLRRVRRLFTLLDEGKARRIAALQQHRSHTAGRLMTNEFFAFHLHTTVAEVSTHMRENPGIEMTNWVFVLGDEMELLGFVPDRNLIVNSSETPLRKLMRPVLHRVYAETHRDEVAELFERYHLPALPVVDHEERLIGVITQGDALEIMEDISNETIANIGGTAEGLTGDEPTWSRYFSRAPWLIVTLCAGLITATGFSLFQGQPWFLAVPFFVPLIAGLSGNVGIQCSTVLIRSMATGSLAATTVGRILKRELRLGVVIGLSFGVICGFAAYTLNRLGVHDVPVDPLLIGTIVSCGVLGACFTSTLLGTMSPLLFDHFGVDPAIASGPIVTACNDVTSTYMYFFIAWCVASAFQVSSF